MRRKLTVVRKLKSVEQCVKEFTVVPHMIPSNAHLYKKSPTHIKKVHTILSLRRPHSTVPWHGGLITLMKIIAIELVEACIPVLV